MTDTNTTEARRAAADRKDPGRDITALGFLLRFAAALALVLATYNPSQYSFFHWVRDAFANDGLGPLNFFVAVILVIGWTILLHATFQSLGSLGIFLGVAFFGTLVWLLVDFGILAANSVSALTWIVLVCLAAMLTIGLTWSAVWRRLTGQVDVVDDNI